MVLIVVIILTLRHGHSHSCPELMSQKRVTTKFKDALMMHLLQTFKLFLFLPKLMKDLSILHDLERNFVIPQKWSNIGGDRAS